MPARRCHTRRLHNGRRRRAQLPPGGSLHPREVRAHPATPNTQRCQVKMAAAQKGKFFPQEPYYIPGYSGFYPQVRFEVGKPYGRITCDVLTDPNVQKSPVSVLAPLTRPKFVGDFTGRDRPFSQCMDQHQNYIPGYSGFVPYQGCIPIPGRVPPRTTFPPQGNRPCVRVPPPGKDTPSCHPGIRLACGPGWRQFASSAGADLHPALTGADLNPDSKMYLCHPDVALVCGRDRGQPCDPGMSLICGQGWRAVPCSGGGAGSEEPTRIEGTPLPLATETSDVCRFDRTPKMDTPNLIQRKAISGYTGYIPRFPWIMGENYLTGVKDAMNEFDRNQEMLRSPMYSFGKRHPRTYWPNTKIYTSGGLMPFYTGFVPTIRDNYAQTFGNSTRQAYFGELQRRQREG
ncbi:ciliary microtubule inner protein 2A [Zootoca vivipara]|uniref:ciliary microtubule inner protein 2A n=1 Tax=Zootoca vivipara TaxID=8524 RepID=UPI0015906C71|nr:ciliary microtubule inner protein 2A [Zootoca vivipara]